MSERPSGAGRVRMAALAAVIGSAIAASSCGSGHSSSGSPSVPSSCAPSGPMLHLSAKNIAFDATFLCAPAGAPVTIEFVNQDSGIPHNVSVFSDPDEKTSVFKGDIVSGSAPVAYHVGSLHPGTYRFRCDVHPSQMQGIVLVVGG